MPHNLPPVEPAPLPPDILADPLTTFLHKSRVHATKLPDLASHIGATPRLQADLADRLGGRLAAAGLSPAAMALAALTVETLTEVCDTLYRPGRLHPEPDQLIREPFAFGSPSRFPRVECWVAAHLCWFGGASQDDAVDHLQTSRETVKRLLDAAGRAVCA